MSSVLTSAHNEIDTNATIGSILESMDLQRNQIILAPFHGEPIPILLQRLTSAQIRACGNISLIETVEDKIRNKNAKKYDKEEIIEFLEFQHGIAEKSLVAPTYKQIMTVMCNNRKIYELRKEADEIDQDIKRTKGRERDLLLEKQFENRVYLDLILPEDFLAYIMTFALQLDECKDIKEVTREMLVECAILAVNGHDNPSEHIDGDFSPFNKEDFNKRAWIEYYKEKKNNEGK